MLAGRPVIAGRAGRAMEIVEEGVNGLLVMPDNAQDLESAIARILDDAVLAAGLVNMGRTSAQERFSLPAVLDEIESVIHVVTRKQRVGTGEHHLQSLPDIR